MADNQRVICHSIIYLNTDEIEYRGIVSICVYYVSADKKDSGST